MTHTKTKQKRKSRNVQTPAAGGYVIESKPLLEQFLEEAREVPAEERALVPKDGATNHDHYLYGKPRRG